MDSDDWPRKFFKPAIRPQEHVLRQVAGVFVVADKTIAELIDRPAVPFDDHVERAGPAVETGGHQFGLAQLGETSQRRPATRGARLVRFHCCPGEPESVHVNAWAIPRGLREAIRLHLVRPEWATTGYMGTDGLKACGYTPAVADTDVSHERRKTRKRLVKWVPVSWWRELALVALGFGVLAVCLTYPLAFHPGSLGRTDNADGQFAIWNVAWVARTLVVDPLHVFDANIFYPHRWTLAYSEANLGAGLLALPVYWFTGSPYTAFNAALLASFVLGGLGMYYLVRYLVRDRRAALIAAIPFAFCPYLFGHIPHIQLLMTAGLPFCLLLFHRLADRPTPGRAIGAGIGDDDAGGFLCLLRRLCDVDRRLRRPVHSRRGAARGPTAATGPRSPSPQRWPSCRRCRWCCPTGCCNRRPGSIAR